MLAALIKSSTHMKAEQKQVKVSSPEITFKSNKILNF